MSPYAHADEPIIIRILLAHREYAQNVTDGGVLCLPCVLLILLYARLHKKCSIASFRSSNHAVFLWYDFLSSWRPVSIPTRSSFYYAP